MADGRQWDGTTYGNVRMHRMLTSILRHTDVRILYAFAAVMVVPPCLVFRSGAKHIYGFYRRHMGYSPVRALAMTYTNHRMFSQMVIDKFAMYAGKKFGMNIRGYEHFLALEKSDRGFVQISSHIGNYEIAGYTLTSERKTFNALVFANEKATVMENRMKMFTKNNIRMIPIKSDMSHLYAVNSAMENGEIISMPGDRVFGSRKILEMDFLGAPAPFPLGTFTIATIRQSDVLSVNVMKTGTTAYTIYVTPLPYDKTAPRREQTRQLAAAYAAELGKMVRKYPAQWFNYYDFWK